MAGGVEPGAGVFPDSGSAARGRDRQIRGALAGGRDMALADAGALDDPRVAGIGLLGQLRVGDDALREVGPAAEHPGMELHQPVAAWGSGTRAVLSCGACGATVTSAGGTCVKCHATLAAGAKFCSACGSPQQVKCLKCGVDLTPGMKFCGDCGASQGAGA